MADRNREGPIGGYFELELPEGSGSFHENAEYYESARVAFRALLKAVRPKALWMPKFICDSMVSPLIDEKVVVYWYDLDQDLNVAETVVLGDGDYLLYVNYFGICDGNIVDLKSRFPKEKLIFDYSQAFFSPPVDGALATIYSPRKYFGVPDGGILITDADTPHYESSNTESVFRMRHLISRLYQEPEKGYSDYIASEASLEVKKLRGMSPLTHRILQSIDYVKVKKRRNSNFLYLHSMLGDRNRLDLDVDCESGPLCYPFLPSERILREQLIQSRVFVPCYWQEALGRVTDSWTKILIRDLLPLPVDQRYGLTSMDRILRLVGG